MEEIKLNAEMILEALERILTTEQINTEHEDLYDASVDRYKKYAKARIRLLKMWQQPILKCRVFLQI